MAAQLGYFTFCVPDTTKGVAFYGDLFGWEFKAAPTDHDKAYRHIENTDVPGGLVNADAAMPFRPYFRVDDIHKTVAKLRELGGTSQDPFETDSGWSCLARDDQGVPFGLWQPAPGL